jgi:hypothetical protein
LLELRSLELDSVDEPAEAGEPAAPEEPEIG